MLSLTALYEQKYERDNRILYASKNHINIEEKNEQILN